MAAKEPRRSPWNTYMPWAFALYSFLSVFIIFIVIASWMPSPAIEGVPPEQTQSTPTIPGLLGILVLVMAGRQLLLRSRARKER